MLMQRSRIELFYVVRPLHSIQLRSRCGLTVVSVRTASRVVTVAVPFSVELRLEGKDGTTAAAYAVSCDGDLLRFATRTPGGVGGPSVIVAFSRFQPGFSLRERREVQPRFAKAHTHLHSPRPSYPWNPQRRCPRLPEAATP